MTKNPSQPGGRLDAASRDQEIAALIGTSADSPPLTECITVFVATAQCGKTFAHRPDGKIEKDNEVRVGTASAKTVHVPSAAELARILKWVASQPNAGVILNAVRGTAPDEEFVIVSMSEMARALHVPVAHGQVPSEDRYKIAGFHTIDGQRCVARMKENFAPCVWALLDRDVDEFTPTQFGAAELPFDAWLKLLDEKLLPGIAGCERVIVPSSSARVVRAEGADAGRPVGAGNGHVFIRVTGDLTRLPVLASQITARAQLAGIAWPKPRNDKATGEQIGESPATIIDPAVLHTGRLVFEGQPHVGAGLQVLPSDIEVRKGFALNLNALPDLTDANIARFNASSHLRLHRNRDGMVGFRDHATMTRATVIEMQGGKKMTVGEWEASSAGHTRIQSPFRASRSFAAFIDRDPLRIYDSGTNTTYFPADKPDPNEAFDAMPDEPDEPDETDAPQPTQAEIRAGSTWRTPALVDIGSDAIRSAPPPKFVIPDWLPAGLLTLFAGHGGASKSMSALMIAMLLATGREVLGRATGAKVPVIFYSAEDRADFIRYRMRRIAAHLGIDPLEWKDTLRVFDATVTDASLWHAASSGTNSRDGNALGFLADQVQEMQAQLVVIDNASDTFDGNEIVRREVTQFARALSRRMSGAECAVLLLAHVNRKGAQGEDDAYSGSTAWHNSARARWSIAQSKSLPAGNLVLELHKSTHGRANRTAAVRIEWAAGVFEVGAPRSSDDMQALLREQVLPALGALIDEKAAVGDYVSWASQSSARYAPKVLYGRVPGNPTEGELKKAIESLITDGLLVDTWGVDASSRKKRKRLELTDKARIILDRPQN